VGAAEIDRELAVDEREDLAAGAYTGSPSTPSVCCTSPRSSPRAFSKSGWLDMKSRMTPVRFGAQPSAPDPSPNGGRGVVPASLPPP
jgi:hypothetical protein